MRRIKVEAFEPTIGTTVTIHPSLVLSAPTTATALRNGCTRIDLYEESVGGGWEILRSHNVGEK